MIRLLKYHILESFNVVRWCLLAIAFAFVAVVSVAKFVQMADLTTLTFSSLEVTYLILNDVTSMIFIYLPIYLFLVCGIMFENHFGELELLKSESRRRYFMAKWLTVLFYTLLFFGVLFIGNYLMSQQVFEHSAVWSSDFLKVQVMLGEDVQSFVHSPLMTIGLSLLSFFLLYFCVGTISMLLALVTRKEAYTLLIALVSGLGMSVLFMYGFEMTRGFSASGYVIQNGMLVVGILMVTLISIAYFNKKDFYMEKKH